ncbi:MAG: hypothetical protein HYW63_02855 [Candidatus Levybacteria bacterium]|nr:hypothetical protein [Candidatus Levybacteria bacterium]
MLIKLIKNQNGQALIEALLALAFAVVIITAVVIAVINALSNTNFTKNQNLGTQYAQEGLDLARNMKDSDYDGFKALANPSPRYYCITDGDFLYIPPDQPCIVGNDFSRHIYIFHGSPLCEANSSFVSSTVSWTDSKCTDGSNCHKIQLDSCFSDPNKAFGT